MWNESATSQQVYAITRLCMAKRIKTELENRIMTRGEAREVIFRLRGLTNPK